MERLYINEILAGNVARFSYFINTYKDLAFTVAMRITNNREDAEEVVQDAFLKTYRALGQFRHDAKFSTWLYKVVVNTALSKTKKKNFFTNATGADVLAEESADEAIQAYSQLAALEQKKYIQQVMDELNAEDALLLTLFYLNENPVQEIHEITGIAPENIKMKLHRARKKMYTLLEQKLKTEIHSLL